jgi:hypothetical protein
MGFVLVVVDASFGGYDAVPDPIGWAMVIAGLVPLRRVIDSGSGLIGLAGLSLLVSAATYPPAVAGSLDESGGWALSLPALAFSFGLCAAVAPAAGRLGGRFRVLRWAFAIGAVGPVLVFGGGVEVLRDPLAFVVVAANIYLIYLLFRASSLVRDGRTEAPDGPVSGPA